MSTNLSESAFWILTALAPAPLHGYAIMRDAREASGGAVNLKATTLYASLERLERALLVEAIGEEVVDGQLVFDYQLHTGPLTTRNAIRILELYDYPPELIAEAYAVQERLLKKPE